MSRHRTLQLMLLMIAGGASDEEARAVLTQDERLSWWVPKRGSLFRGWPAVDQILATAHGEARRTAADLLTRAVATRARSRQMHLVFLMAAVCLTSILILLQTTGVVPSLLIQAGWLDETIFEGSANIEFATGLGMFGTIEGWVAIIFAIFSFVVLGWLIFGGLILVLPSDCAETILMWTAASWMSGLPPTRVLEALINHPVSNLPRRLVRPWHDGAIENGLDQRAPELVHSWVQRGLLPDDCKMFGVVAEADGYANISYAEQNTARERTQSGVFWPQSNQSSTPLSSPASRPLSGSFKVISSAAVPRSDLTRAYPSSRGPRSSSTVGPLSNRPSSSVSVPTSSPANSQGIVPTSSSSNAYPVSSGASSSEIRTARPRGASNIRRLGAEDAQVLLSVARCLPERTYPQIVRLLMLVAYGFVALAVAFIASRYYAALALIGDIG